MSFYDFSARDIYGEEVRMEQYKGNVVLVVNTASKCGLTPQLKGLEEIYRQHKDGGLQVLGFPCNQFANQESGNNKEIQDFCQLNYGVTFTMFEKIDVNGENAHPLYKFLKSQTKGIFSKEIKWNFTKFLIDQNGNVIKRYSPITSPIKIEKDIEKLIQTKR
ncbi:glutathione peroxidase [Alkaliphilus hydrothermalis]|uniref:Glutathione peroxidase n=1 Tax=Alkaliphilus hydrothermalis TaxID=1482730 RepID=A0ABS2NSE5_9FIRM|nr:glutathione peroxidase [Alkaliphilus hydrothermalis]MBM7615878.1 glutathione peroxidase [Alkaliphilus hydrothermalis]